MKKVGLRIDVDTWRGTRLGMPRLLDILEQYDVRASVFFSVGPDNMGRHLWRLLKPAFLTKMLRTRAAKLYGWDILLAGTFWPGRRIGAGNHDIIRRTAIRHEVGLHAWDHFAWQTFAGSWKTEQLYADINRGVTELEAITGRSVACSAAAGWRADEDVLRAKEIFGFRYNSDCRGECPFIPLFEDGKSGTVQIPVSLPTWDEVVGRETSATDFNRYLLDKIHSHNGIPVYTLHAEVEGIAEAANFEALLELARHESVQFCPLGELLPENPATLPQGRIVRGRIAGREGWLGCQEKVRKK